VFASAADALKYIKDNQIAMVDLKIVGMAGQWLHLTIPARQFTQKHFEEGVGYDGSSGAASARSKAAMSTPCPA
jgi:glutamine synthetase